jgi:hypothetical protein
MEKKVIPGLEIIFQDDLPESQLELTHMFWNQSSLEEILADINLLVLLCKKWELYPHEMKQPEWRPYFIYDNPQWYTFSEKMEGYGKLCSLLAEVCKARGLDPSPLNNLASQFISTIMPAMAEDKRRWLDAQYQWINMANEVKPLVFQLRLRLASEIKVPAAPPIETPENPQHRKISAKKKRSSKKSNDNPIHNTPVTLREFLMLYCEPILEKLLKSRINSLQNGERQKKIKLPPCVGEWKSGKPKRYKPADLKGKWAEYLKFNPSIPKLKSSEKTA